MIDPSTFIRIGEMMLQCDDVTSEDFRYLARQARKACFATESNQYKQLNNRTAELSSRSVVQSPPPSAKKLILKQEGLQEGSHPVLGYNLYRSKYFAIVQQAIADSKQVTDAQLAKAERELSLIESKITSDELETLLTHEEIMAIANTHPQGFEALMERLNLIEPKQSAKKAQESKSSEASEDVQEEFLAKYEEIQDKSEQLLDVIFDESGYYASNIQKKRYKPELSAFMICLMAVTDERFRCMQSMLQAESSLLFRISPPLLMAIAKKSALFNKGILHEMDKAYGTRLEDAYKDGLTYGVLKPIIENYDEIADADAEAAMSEDENEQE